MSDDKSSKSKKNKFTVDMLFPNGPENYKKSSKPMSVDDLVKNLRSYNEIPDVEIKGNSAQLLAILSDRRNKVIKLYKKMLANCWDIIIDKAEHAEDEITFYPDVGYPEYPDYKLNECLEYLQKELRTEYLDTEICDNCIYVSWENLENNINECKRIGSIIESELDSQSSHDDSSES